MLVVENDPGRVLEIGPGGELVREFVGYATPFDAFLVAARFADASRGSDSYTATRRSAECAIV